MPEKTLDQILSANTAKSSLISDFSKHNEQTKKAFAILNRYGMSQIKLKVDRVELDVNQHDINSYIDFLLSGLFKDLSIDYKEKVASIQVTKSEQCYQFEIVDEHKDTFSIYSVKSVRSTDRFVISIYGYRQQVHLNYASKLRRSIFGQRDGLIVNELRNVLNNDTNQLLTFLMYHAYDRED